MQIDRLDARELDYWTARALARDELPLIFVAVEPDIVVTVASGGFRRMDSRFSPAAEWADAAVVLERVVELRSTRVGEARASVTASFAGDGTAATTPTARARTCATRCCGPSFARDSATRSSRCRPNRMPSATAASRRIGPARRCPATASAATPRTIRTKSAPCRGRDGQATPRPANRQ